VHVVEGSRPTKGLQAKLSLKRGDRLSKKERQTTASELGKKQQIAICAVMGQNVCDGDIYYNKTSDKASTK
jgi:hypothetical protein